MNEKNNEKGKNTTKGFANESGSKEKEKNKEDKSDSKADETFCKMPKVNIFNIDTIAIFTGIESLLKSASKLDAQLTIYAGDLYLKVQNYFKNTIESYKDNM